jgi:hypothetical protein
MFVLLRLLDRLSGESDMLADVFRRWPLAFQRLVTHTCPVLVEPAAEDGYPPPTLLTWIATGMSLRAAASKIGQ